MTTVLAAFPDAERIVAQVLAGLGTIGSETGIDLQDVLPFIRVRRIGGADNRITDAARIDVQVYAVAAGDARTLAETIRQRLISGPSATSAGVLDRADTEAGPQEIPSPDPDRYRIVTATYQVSVRRR